MTHDAAHIVETLRAHRAEFEAMGVKHLALFGSHVSGSATGASDIDIGVAFDQTVRRPAIGYFGLRQRLQDRLATLLNRDIDLSDEALQKPAVKETYEAARLYAF